MVQPILTRTALAGLVAGVGLAGGGLAIATAGTSTSNADLSAATGAAIATDDSRGHRGGPGGFHGGAIAQTLASELSLELATVEAALEAVHEELHDDATLPTTPPTDAERAAKLDEMATALAAELDVEKADVVAALAVVQKQFDAERATHRKAERAALVTRLNGAVKAGTLTKADKASVLKAFDANLIGHGPGMAGFGMSGPR